MAKLSAKRKKLIREILTLAKTKLYSKPSDALQTICLKDHNWSQKRRRNICAAVWDASRIFTAAAKSDSQRIEIRVAVKPISIYIQDALGDNCGYVEEWLQDNGYIPIDSYIITDDLYKRPSAHHLAMQVIEYRRAWVDQMINEVFV